MMGVGVWGGGKGKKGLGENVMMEWMGGCWGVIVGGGMLRLGGVYILEEK